MGCLFARLKFLLKETQVADQTTENDTHELVPSGNIGDTVIRDYLGGTKEQPIFKGARMGIYLPNESS